MSTGGGTAPAVDSRHRRSPFGCHEVQWRPAMLLGLLVHLRDALQTMGTHTPERSLWNGMVMRGRVNGQTLARSTAQPPTGSP